MCQCQHYCQCKLGGNVIANVSVSGQQHLCQYQCRLNILYINTCVVSAIISVFVSNSVGFGIRVCVSDSVCVIVSELLVQLSVPVSILELLPHSQFSFMSQVSVSDQCHIIVSFILSGQQLC